MNRGIMSLLGAVLLMSFNTLALAEPPTQMSPITRGLLKGGLIVGGGIGKALDTLAPSCVQDIEKCWKAKGLNKDNIEQVQDACWKESKVCSKACKDVYSSRRKAGKSSLAADPINTPSESCTPY